MLAILRESGLNPGQLCLELTERCRQLDMEFLKEQVEFFRFHGIKVAMDDFGSGYSSLNHIREIPFDIIKVDQSFVKDLAENAYSQAFVKMVAELAVLRVCVAEIGLMQPVGM